MNEHIISPDEAYEVADAFAQVSARILDFRVEAGDLTDDEAEELERCEDTLDALVVLFRGYGIKLLGERASDAAQDLSGAIRDARDTLQNIADTKRAILIAAAVVELAVAVQIGNVKGVVTSIAGVAAALKDENAEDAPD
jgi:hypothetical protein